MNYIRQARYEDVERIAEILVFNYRLNFYPIFQDESFYFEELKVSKQIANYVNDLDSIWVYDDGVVKGFIQIEKEEVRKLFVEPALQGKSIGAALLEYKPAEQTGPVGRTDLGVPQQRSEHQGLVQRKWHLRADLLSVAEAAV